MTSSADKGNLWLVILLKEDDEKRVVVAFQRLAGCAPWRRVTTQHDKKCTVITSSSTAQMHRVHRRCCLKLSLRYCITQPSINSNDDNKRQFCVDVHHCYALHLLV